MGEKMQPADPMFERFAERFELILHDEVGNHLREIVVHPGDGGLDLEDLENLIVVAVAERVEKELARRLRPNDIRHFVHLALLNLMEASDG